MQGQILKPKINCKIIAKYSGSKDLLTKNNSKKGNKLLVLKKTTTPTEVNRDEKLHSYEDSGKEVNNQKIAI